MHAGQKAQPGGGNLLQTGSQDRALGVTPRAIYCTWPPTPLCALGGTMMV